MNGEDVLGVLKEIRDEVRQTNGRIDQTNTRLDQTNARLESVDGRLHLVEGRFEFLERSVTKGFADVRDTLADRAEQIERLISRQTQVELRLTTELGSVASAMDQVRDLIARKLDDHAMMLSHEERIRALEQRE